MATLHKWPSRPVLDFLKVRNYQPLLVRTVQTKTSRGDPRRPSSIRPPPTPRAVQQTGNSSIHHRNNAPVPSPPPAQPQQPSLSALLSKTDASSNTLLAPVHIPEDPRAVLKSNHPSTALLEQSGIVVQRQIEMMNVFLGFEQANRYVILSPEGDHIGYMAEHDGDAPTAPPSVVPHARLSAAERLALFQQNNQRASASGNSVQGARAPSRLSGPLAGTAFGRGTFSDEEGDDDAASFDPTSAGSKRKVPQDFDDELDDTAKFRALELSQTVKNMNLFGPEPDRVLKPKHP